MNETIKNIGILGAIGMSALSLNAGDVNVTFDPKYFPVVEDKVTLDTSEFDAKYFSKSEKIQTSQIEGMPETISYSNALLNNLIVSTDVAVAKLSEKQVQANLNQSSTTAPDYVKGRGRISDLELRIAELEAKLKP